MHRQRRNKGQTMRGWIVRAGSDQRAAIEIAFWAFPLPPQSSAPAALSPCADPQTLTRALPRSRYDIGVGGPGLLNTLNKKGQNNDPAALSAIAPSHGMAKYPNGDTNNAATKATQSSSDTLVTAGE